MYTQACIHRTPLQEGADLQTHWQANHRLSDATSASAPETCLGMDLADISNVRLIWSEPEKTIAEAFTGWHLHGLYTLGMRMQSSWKVGSRVRQR